MAKTTDYYTYPKSLGKETKQGQHYILFNSYESKSAISAEGLMQSSIALYIPPGSLTTSINQQYGDLQGGATMAATRRGIFDGTGTWGGFAQGAADVITGIGNSSEKTQNFMAASAGLAKNNHVALAYKGPGQFRTHSFNFSFFPKDDTEAEMVNGIINDFQNGSTPRIVGQTGASTKRITAPFFASPRQWDIKFMIGSKSTTNTGGSTNHFLHQLKRSVITGMTINHDPNSVVSFHEDGSPVTSSLSLTFQEIEYVTSGDTVDADLNKLADRMETQRIQMKVNAREAKLTASQKKNPHL